METTAEKKAFSNESPSDPSMSASSDEFLVVSDVYKLPFNTDEAKPFTNQKSAFVSLEDEGLKFTDFIEKNFLNLDSDDFISVINVYDEENGANEFVNTLINYSPPIEPSSSFQIFPVNDFDNDVKVTVDSAHALISDEFKVVFVLDDSSSMNETVQQPFLSSQSKWDELKIIFKSLVGVIPSIRNTELYFLNKWVSGLRNLSYAQIINYLDELPLGMSLIDQTFKQILSHHKSETLQEKKLLIIVLTDGEITNSEGLEDLDSWKKTFMNLPTNVFVTIINISDDMRVNEFLNTLCSNYSNVANGDLTSLRKSMKNIQQSSFQSIFSDYLSKLIAKFKLY